MLLLISYPRTASNLLLRILNAPSTGYPFFPAIDHLRDTVLNIPISQWTPSQVKSVFAAYQSCWETYQQSLDSSTITKEHASFMMSPGVLSDFLHGGHSPPWKVDQQIPHSVTATTSASAFASANPSVLPDHFLLQNTPLFLIRHPLLSFPSYHRVIRSFTTSPAHFASLTPYISLGCTLRWSKTLYDWYVANGVSPIIIDADDFLTSRDLVLRLAERVGLDPTNVQFTWDAADAGDEVAAKARISLLKSEGIVGGKTLEGSDEGLEKWEWEFGVWRRGGWRVGLRMRWGIMNISERGG